MWTVPEKRSQPPPYQKTSRTQGLFQTLQKAGSLHQDSLRIVFFFIFCLWFSLFSEGFGWLFEGLQANMMYFWVTSMSEWKKTSKTLNTREQKSACWWVGYRLLIFFPSRWGPQHARRLPHLNPSWSIAKGAHSDCARDIRIYNIIAKECKRCIVPLSLSYTANGWYWDILSAEWGQSEIERHLSRSSCC